MRRRAWPGRVRLLGSIAVATTCGVLPGFLIGAQAVQLSRDLGLRAAAVGGAVAVSWLAASASSAAMGRLSERLGGATALRLAACGAGTAMLAVAVFARSWPTLAAGAAAGGVANALAQPAANVMIVSSLPPHRHGAGFGVKQAAVPAATLLGGLAVPTVALTVGWRWSFAAGAVLAAAAALAVPGASRAVRAPAGPVAPTDPPDPPDPQDPPEPRGRPAGPGGASSGPPPPPGPVEPTGVVASATGTSTLAGRRGVLAVLGTGIGFGAAGAAALATFLVAGAVAAGVGEAAAGLLLTAGSAVGIVVRLLLGVRADRVGGDQLPLVVAMLVAGAAALVVFSTGAAWAYVLAAPAAFGLGWAWPGLFNLSVVRRFPDTPGAATGITQTGTYLGAGVGPVVFGLLVDGPGFGVAWLLAASWFLLAAAAVAVGRRLPAGPAGVARR